MSTETIKLQCQALSKTWPKLNQQSSEFAIFRAQIETEGGKKEVIGIKGKLSSVSVGDTLEVKGTEEIHDKFGRQINVSEFKTITPRDAVGIQKFIESIRGVGGTTAKWIVEAYGDKALEVIERDGVEAIRKLTNRDGNKAIKSEARIYAVYNAIMDRTKLDDVKIQLRSLGFNSAQIGTIVNHRETIAAEVLGEPSELIQIVKSNPYALRSLPGIGFKTVDAVAIYCGILTTSPDRIRAGIEYCLSQVEEKGSTAFPVEQFEMITAKALSVDVGHVKKYLIHHDGVVRFKDTYASSLISSEENLIAQWFVERVAKTSPLKEESDGSIQLSEDQIKAVKMALSENVSIITGGPGTGKTTITKTIVRSFVAGGLNIGLGSPTGRAASNLQEVTQYEAVTTYRLLGYNPWTGGFSYNSRVLLPYDCVLLDETSMVGVSHFLDILRAIPRTCRLILVGDADQLPSVSCGRVLQDLIESGIVPVVRLEKIFRQAEGSKIVTNAHRVRKGEQVVSGTVDNGDDFFVSLLGYSSDWPESKKVEAREKGQDVLLKTVERIEERFGITDIQVMCPMKKGALGTKELNSKLRDLRNKDGIRVCKGRFRLGDRVIVTKNIYDEDVWRMNGEVGVVLSYREQPEEMVVLFGKDKTTFQKKHFGVIELAYAMTIHKSQGSQFKAVVICMHDMHMHMAQRDLLYTAITRAQELCVIIGTDKCLKKAIRTRGGGGRITRLKEWIEEIKCKGSEWSFKEIERRFSFDDGQIIEW